MFRLVAAALAMLIVAPASAEAFQKISDKTRFVQAVENKELTRMGIGLDVTPDGKIIGRAFGRDVRGNWTWQDGYFCRDLYWGQRDLGYNCQEVKLNGQTIRFTSDRGTGQFADLTLR
ncbi:dihydrodipicolinate reductase [Cognatishimia sp. MH4019]|uniref:dihydrodipicolinate reductase n=1 Tax=Cognatishimia sp. MH4019 TaxID=2854030 RepID=UPI001CD67122|nr:dihydrodipicolinate reductase [Cognatishimia sp. MH4019]